MKDYLISTFIDDELDIDEKIAFVHEVHGDEVFMKESVDLLEQEKLVRSPVVDDSPALVFERKKRFFSPRLFRMHFLVPALAAAVLFFFFMAPSKDTPKPFRFVLYEPEANHVEIAGSFTNWKKIPLKKIGLSGYWDLTLDIPKGEHRFTYILQGDERIADPTIPARERDDFGGENSILLVTS